ncbi:unnamed protein product [Schistocephalus solidus]|uniref:RNA-binding protein MEX3B n=1 Tax=Schistocephalus solidus TaxID=70667 RepID=A0A183T184_SCHSO|nr:unnamed protein product [Schistocephalus solidus]
MPSATNDSFSDDLLNDQMLAFMNNVDYGSLSNRGSTNGINTIELPASTQKTLSLDKNGALSISKGYPAAPVTCNSPTHHMSTGFAALASPGIINKYAPGTLGHMFSNPNDTKPMDDYHSLQNSPFYNHYPVNMNFHPIKRQNSPGSSVLLSCQSNGVSPRDTGNITSECQIPPPRQPPQRELFPHAFSRCDPSMANAISINSGSGLLIQDRLQYYVFAQKQGFIVGPELDRIKENSRRSTSHSYGRISAHFRNRYGETEAKTKASYMQLGVRVPSKDHVSEIVGKGGQKIKLIREETGALITTPGEYEDHVFIIEAPPTIALRVANLIATRAQEISQSKLSASERRRGSTSSISGNAAATLFGVNGSLSGNNNAAGAANSQSANCISPSGFLNGGQVPCGIPRNHDDPASVPSPSPLLKVPGSPGGPILNSFTSVQSPAGGVPGTDNSAFIGTAGCSGFAVSVGGPGAMSHGMTSVGVGSGGGGGGAAVGSSGSGRILLARSKISVPQDMVGKIIGTQGSIITTIQKDTGTEIKSPPKEAARGPSATSEFEISAYQSLGMTTNQAAECRVQQAKQLIGHLVMRQLERRASEELDDHSCPTSANGHKNSSGTDEGSSDLPQQSTCGGGGSSGRVVWMWPDVAQMDSIEAREVLDRILAESKSKTRRAKELASGSGGACSVPPSPGGSALSAAGFPGGIDLFSEKTLSSPTAATMATSLSSVSMSCHTSPFHQSPSVRVAAPILPPPTAFNPSAAASSTQSTLNLLNGFISDRRHPAHLSGCEFDEPSDFGNVSTEPHQQSFLHNHHMASTAPPQAAATSVFWQNLNHPEAASIHLSALNLASTGSHHSFSNPRLNDPQSSLSPRRNNDFGLKHLRVTDLYPEVSESANCKSTDWRLGLNSDTETLLDSCTGAAGHHNIPAPAFDLIQALDSLCLTSNDSVGEATRDLSYPPGFDDRTARVDAQWPVGSNLLESSIFNGFVPNGNTTHGGGQGSGGAGAAGACNCDTRNGSSFSNTPAVDTLQATDAMRSIWSSDGPSENGRRVSAGFFPGLSFPSSVINSFSGKGNTIGNDTNRNGNTSSASSSNSSSGSVTNNRCGAVGDGRRRPSPPAATSAVFSSVSNSDGLAAATTSIQAV